MNGEAVNQNKFSFFLVRIQVLSINHPQWRTWLVSLLAWMYLLANVPTAQREKTPNNSLIYCSPITTTSLTNYSNHPSPTILEEPVSSKIFTTLRLGLLPWGLMVVAMMFPLLNEPIKHVSLSLRLYHRELGMSTFIIAYSLVWMLAALLFLLLSLGVNEVLASSTPLVSGIMKSIGFILTGLIVWLPSRPTVMMKCSQTMPIRMHGWPLVSDSCLYGLKMGLACLNMCWPIMLALVFAHHNLALMYVVTTVLIGERYLLAHTSRLPGYAWLTIGLIVFGFEI